MKYHTHSHPIGSQGAKGRNPHTRWRPILSTVLVMGVLFTSGPGAFGGEFSTMRDGSVVAAATVKPAVWPGYAECNIKHMDEEGIENWVENVVLAAGTGEVFIDCNLTLKPGDVVTKLLMFQGEEASNHTLNCNGATLMTTVNGNGGRLAFESNRRNGEWKRPENITIKNCNIIGFVYVGGIGGKTPVRESSKTLEHTAHIRNISARNIVFDNVTISGAGVNRTGVLFYIGAGVTDSQLVNSEITGKGDLAIYLDSESAYNTIKNNYIHVDTTRELIAIDGSSHNQIMNNIFSGLDHGGIYLYRNCGEFGIIRHSPPEYNQIVNNIFYYNKYYGEKPAVYLGSRNGKTPAGNDAPYCGEDEKEVSIYGTSSVSDLDHATNNLIMQNQFYEKWIWSSPVDGESFPELVKPTIEDMIQTQNSAVNSPNFIGDEDSNKNVDKDTVVKVGTDRWAQRIAWLREDSFLRLAGCYVANGTPDFIVHGRVIPSASGAELSTCNNGTLEPTPLPKIQSPTPGSSLRQTSVTFTGEDRGRGELRHWFQIYNANGARIFSKYLGTNASVNVSELPATGTISVRYWTALPQGWKYQDQTYTMQVANVPPKITSPVPGTILYATTMTFTGKHTNDHLYHYLYVGTTKGGTNISRQFMGTNPQVRVSGLPTSGTIYVRYWTRFKVGGWKYQDHTYTMRGYGWNGGTSLFR